MSGSSLKKIKSEEDDSGVKPSSIAFISLKEKKDEKMLLLVIQLAQKKINSIKAMGIEIEEEENKPLCSEYDSLFGLKKIRNQYLELLEQYEEMIPMDKYEDFSGEWEGSFVTEEKNVCEYQGNELLSISFDILVEVAFYLSVYDILNLCLTSKMAKQTMWDNEDFWKRLFVGEFPDEEKPTKTYKEEYITKFTTIDPLRVFSIFWRHNGNYRNNDFSLFSKFHDSLFSKLPPRTLDDFVLKDWRLVYRGKKIKKLPGIARNDNKNQFLKGSMARLHFIDPYNGIVSISATVYILGCHSTKLKDEFDYKDKSSEYKVHVGRLFLNDIDKKFFSDFRKKHPFTRE
jgi:hypothetical protein